MLRHFAREVDLMLGFLAHYFLSLPNLHVLCFSVFSKRQGSLCAVSGGVHNCHFRSLLHGLVNF